MHTIAVVGASLAGLRAAEELRAQGFDGRVTLVGDESHKPYDRPPLSKQLLAGSWDLDRIGVRPVSGTLDDLDVDWRLGAAATSLDTARCEVHLAGGDRVAYDSLIVATGASPRLLPGTDHLHGVFTLRTVDDCLAIRAALDAGAQRVVVVGFGFIGAEVAATCRERGLDVTIVEALPVPMERALGPEMGMVCAAVHREHGVDVRLGVGVLGIDADRDDHVQRVRLTDGTSVAADVVVVGIGVTPNTGWLEGSGLVVDNGVVCDETLQAGPGIVAAGDVARWPSRRFGETVRVEHWDNAIDMGAYAARRVLGVAQEPYDPVPWFWSDQYDRKIQLAGLAAPADEVRVVVGSVDERRFVALYGRRDRIVGVLGFNRPRDVMRYRTLIEAGASWTDALDAAQAQPR